MKSYDHVKWLAFLKKAAELPLSYSMDELKSLKEISDELYPSMSPLIAACMILVKGQSNTEPRQAVLVSKVSTMRPASSDNLIYFHAFMDINTFPKNSDLIAFARSRFPGMPNFRFDKMSRRRIAQAIVSYMEETGATASNIQNIKPADKQKNAESGDEFLSVWERTIRGS